MNATYACCRQCHRLNKINLDLASQKVPICGQCHTEIELHGAVSDLDSEGFQIMCTKSPLPVVIDLWAPWCGPCRAFAPTFLSTANSFIGQAVFAKVNTQIFPQVSENLAVRGIPTFVIFKAGKEIARLSGAIPELPFKQWISEHI